MAEIGGNEASTNTQATSINKQQASLSPPAETQDSAGENYQHLQQAGDHSFEQERSDFGQEEIQESISLCQNGHKLESGELFCMVCGLSERAEAVQRKIREHRINVDESLLAKALLSQTRRELEAEWVRKRSIFPESGHELIAALLERKNLTEEDLILLLCADAANFISAEEILDRAEKLAGQTFSKRGKKAGQLKQTKFDREAAAQTLKLSRAEIYEEIDSRIFGFARCSIEVVDAWADAYRLEKQMPIERCLVLLAVPGEFWQQLPKQQYIAEILKFGERRIMATINQGPLVYLRIGRNSSTLDLRELDTAALSSEKILEHFVSRASGDIEVNPDFLKAVPMLERRIRGLVQKTTIFKRDTGKHGMFLGFPFVVLRSHANDDTRMKLRVAPVLLFPVRIDAQIGNKGKIILANSDSDEVRLNPALVSILGLSAKEEEHWKESVETLLSAESVKPKEIVKALANFCPCSDVRLMDIPGKEFVSELDRPVLSYSAALFHCDFTGKAVADDLTQICGQPITGTALELALRIADKKETESDAEKLVQAGEAEIKFDASNTFDLEDFSVIAADPSQETAVRMARENKGLHIEGPPGTGKSQTIVNIIADCVARKETVLVICQKQAALTVVEKRLKAEGLGRRLFYITDISRDRQAVVRALREQLDERHSGQGTTLSFLRRERNGLATRIQALEAELNKQHTALHNVDEKIGLSYRNVLTELIQIESEDPYILKIPRLRTLLKDFDNAAVTALSEECASIANLWLESKFEISPLQDLKSFAPDETDAQTISNEFMRFMKAEEQRFKTLNEYPRSADVDDIAIYVGWLRENEDYIREIPREVRLNLSKWVAHFFPDGSAAKSAGKETINRLMQVSEQLSKLSRYDHSNQIFASLAKLSLKELNHQIAIAESATSKGGFLSQINPIQALNRHRLRNILGALQMRNNDKAAHEFLKAALLERSLRPHRELLEQISKSLYLELPEQALDLQKLQHYVSVLLNQLAPVAELSGKLQSCPLALDAREFAGRSEPAAFDEFTERLQGVIRRHAVKTESLNRLNALTEWFDEEWISVQKRIISSGKGNIEAARHMQRYLQTIVPFQEFRLRSKSLSPQALEVLASLREHETMLCWPVESMAPPPQGLPPLPQSFVLGQFAPEAPVENKPESSRIQNSENSGQELLKRIRRVIRREACLAWKSQLETQEPALTIPKEEINYKVKSLAEAEKSLRDLNRRILSEPDPDSSIAQEKQWEDLTRLSGTRARRLRELVANGAGLGLMQLRPIWLMNPETASRLLPLSPGLFDVVIFDEASQLLVEYAFPTLFRAKRAIVSGDEKQMPPPTFFSTRVQNDEIFNMDEDEIDEMLPQAERDRMEEAWNRREIKDCPDLLNLASAVLPSRSLQIHYRSEFRELIAFSNAAFYSGTLSIPSKRPASAVKKIRPIEVVNVNSVYEKQVNRGEAIKVAEILQKLWSAPKAERPTIGVVTFNLKQAELIEEVLEDIAHKSESFKDAFEEESNRTEDGEDLGFFIKNLENVQGDERDIIIFSTTFGLDSAGSFRRNFGKLGQDGGERRLNVAITRAKRKVILVTSLPTEKISDYLHRNGQPVIPRDYVQAYMDYAAKLSSGSLESAQKSLSRLQASDAPRKRFDSGTEDPFISDVASYIRSLGYEPVTRARNSGDAFEIDIAVEHPRTGLFAIGIECDAPSHRLLASAKHREIWRPSVLGKSIAKIHRISSREWYQKREREKDILRNTILQAIAQGDS